MSLTVSELFSLLSYGELSNLSMSTEGGGSIELSKQPTVILYANEALLKLHSRFCLSEKDLNLELVPHITNYHLIPRFAESNQGEKHERYPYIKDLLCEKFEGDVIRVLSVYDKFGCELPLNDAGNPLSVFTPQPVVLQVPHPTAGMSLAVHYQARHRKLSVDCEEDETIELPDTLHVALTSYIAYNVYTTINTAEATAKAQEHLAKYEATCQEAEEKDLVSTSTSQTNVRFHRNGWV